MQKHTTHAAISRLFLQNITHKNNPIVETKGLINQNQLLIKYLSMKAKCGHCIVCKLLDGYLFGSFFNFCFFRK